MTTILSNAALEAAARSAETWNPEVDGWCCREWLSTRYPFEIDLDWETNVGVELAVELAGFG